MDSPNSPNDKPPFSALKPPPRQQAMDLSDLQGSALPVRTDRLYQIAALAAGIILLVTAF